MCVGFQSLSFSLSGVFSFIIPLICCAPEAREITAVCVLFFFRVLVFAGMSVSLAFFPLFPRPCGMSAIRVLFDAFLLLILFLLAGLAVFVSRSSLSFCFARCFLMGVVAVFIVVCQRPLVAQ